LAYLLLNVPVTLISGVLATDSIERAIERAGTKAGSKGYDAAAKADLRDNSII